MSSQDIVSVLIFAIAVFGSAPFLGAYMARVYQGGKHPLSFLEGAERLFYRLCGIDAAEGMAWKKYLGSVAAFSAASLAAVFLIQVLQAHLPLNPQGLPGVKWDLALNTAISFMTNTNWQSYSGETTLSYFSQSIALTVQNFLSAAAGMAVAIALIRGIIARNQGQEHAAPSRGRAAASAAPQSLGNFWVDMTRTVLYILLPLSIIVALILVSQGVIQNFHPYVSAVSLEGKKDLIPMGPAASQIAIKQLGTNGGGFFGPNSAYPFENPTPFSNLVELISILLIPAAFPFLFGSMVGKKRQGFVLFAVMLSLYAIGVWAAMGAEYRWGSLEGKELRFGPGLSALWAATTTVTSNGSVNAMHDSLSPLGGMVPLINMMLGEVVFGGVGSGMYGMLALVFITVFIAGLMVGRGPEYLGKKIEAKDVQLSMAAIIAPNFVILMFSAIGIAVAPGIAAISNPGPHGLTQVLYAFTSAAANNGSAFAGLGTNSLFYNLMQGLGMLVGRFGVIVPMLAVAGNLAEKKTVPESAGTFKTDTRIFGVLLLFVIVIVAGLTHFLVLILGPVLEHFLLIIGVLL
jgi:K+-transporting ATPase ATPase A chain